MKYIISFWLLCVTALLTVSALLRKTRRNRLKAFHSVMTGIRSNIMTATRCWIFGAQSSATRLYSIMSRPGNG